MPPTSQKPVLICGAGLASLLLGRSLLRSKIPFIIFERDSSISFRGQGYRLRMSTEGLDAIEEVLGPEPNGFPKFWETTGSRLASDGVREVKKQLDDMLDEGGGAIFIDEAYQLTGPHNFNGGQVLDFGAVGVVHCGLGAEVGNVEKLDGDLASSGVLDEVSDIIGLVWKVEILGE